MKKEATHRITVVVFNLIPRHWEMTRNDKPASAGDTKGIWHLILKYGFPAVSFLYHLLKHYS